MLPQARFMAQSARAKIEAVPATPFSFFVRLEFSLFVLPVLRKTNVLN